jgi:hypothetical protein
MPASVSSFKLFGSCHVMWTRVGTRMIAAAPYALHWFPPASSFAGSHASAASRAACVTGMLDTSS